MAEYMQELFDFMEQEHHLTLTDGELHDLIHAVQNHLESEGKVVVDGYVLQLLDSLYQLRTKAFPNKPKVNCSCHLCSELTGIDSMMDTYLRREEKDSGIDN